MALWTAVANATLSNGDLTVTTTGPSGRARADTAITGRVYWESTVVSVGTGSFGIGVANDLENSFVAASSNSAGTLSDGAVYTNNGGFAYVTSSKVVSGSQVALQVGDVIQQWVDKPNNKAWWAVNGGTPNTYIAGDPSSGAGAVGISYITGSLYPYFEADDTGFAVSSNFAGPWTYDSLGYGAIGGVAGSGASRAAFSVSGAGGVGVSGQGASAARISASAQGAHGVAGTADVAVSVSPAVQGAYGEGRAASVVAITASGSGAVGVGGQAGSSVACSVAGLGTHIQGVSGAVASAVLIRASASGSYLEVNGGWTPIAANAETWTPASVTPETWTAA